MFRRNRAANRGCDGGFDQVRIGVDAYGDVTAVQNLNLACAEGEMLALLGPSGCGKSSTVKMAAGIEDVSAGEIFIGDRPVSRRAPAARNIAMVFDDYALYPHMTVRENISFPLAISHLPSAEIKARVDHVLDLLALHPFADQNNKTLDAAPTQKNSLGRFGGLGATRQVQPSSPRSVSLFRPDRAKLRALWSCRQARGRRGNAANDGTRRELTNRGIRLTLQAPRQQYVANSSAAPKHPPNGSFAICLSGNKSGG